MSSFAEQYNNSSKSVQSINGYELLRKLPIDIQKGWKVADIGCGTGIMALEISRIVGESGMVLAIDPNSRRIDYLRQQPESQAKNLIILNQPAEDCSLKDYGQFDLVFSNIVMHWIPENNLKIILKSVFDALNQNGYLAVAIAEMSLEEGGYRSMFHTSLPEEEKKKLFTHVITRPLDWYVNLAKASGFTILDEGYVYQNFSYKNVEDFLQKLRGTFEDIVDFEKYFTLPTIKEAGFYQVNEDGSLLCKNTRFSFFIAQKK